ncbi:MAG TPA: hypothetical protein VFB84_01910 [Micromonosporaceae bacterium]|nr:hypothetical protein [Micromonosporaceae bacterium]
MRRVLALAALAAALFAAGCGDTNDSTTGGSPATTLADNTKEVCAAAEKAIADGTTRLGGEMGRIATAAATGDAAAKQQALDSVKNLLKSWSTGVRAEADRATNPELKQALTTFSAEVDKMDASLTSFDKLKDLGNFETPEIKTASETVNRLC